MIMSSYAKRFALAASCATCVLSAHAIAWNSAQRFDLVMVLAVVAVIGACSLLPALLVAMAVKKSPVALVMLTQVASLVTFLLVF